ncbi:hypothetical protein [Ruminococcus sp. AM42-11]|uniref:hypothetical protein n=1 Tax=Ruminococcus sp. AM42-11 TaxID=2292372 RepID=UPI0019224066|nr:hypothetical protein [Ruminococcus sp. AM42-11]
MKKLEKPQFDMETIIDNCLVHMQNPRKKRITLVKEKIKKKTEEYDELAQHGQLHIIPSMTQLTILQLKKIWKLYIRKDLFRKINRIEHFMIKS